MWRTGSSSQDFSILCIGCSFFQKGEPLRREKTGIAVFEGFCSILRRLEYARTLRTDREMAVIEGMERNFQYFKKLKAVEDLHLYRLTADGTGNCRRTAGRFYLAVKTGW